MNEKNLVIERVFNVSREKLWQAWTQEDLIAKWWGPSGFTAPTVQIDFREGGKFLFSMASPDFFDGREIFSTGTYKDIVPMEKIVMTDSFADEQGNVVPASYYDMEEHPLEMLVTITFEEISPDKTKLTLVHEGVDKVSDEARSGMEQGWSEIFDKLASEAPNA
jgi:uncharacterized protein YndB with AHSA1/START domain